MNYVIYFHAEVGTRGFPAHLCRGTMRADEPMEVGTVFGHKGEKVIVTACRECNVIALRTGMVGD